MVLVAAKLVSRQIADLMANCIADSIVNWILDCIANFIAPYQHSWKVIKGHGRSWKLMEGPRV